MCRTLGDLTSMRVDYKAWVGAQDGLLYKVEMNLNVADFA